jgi:hypothetical protein
MAEEPRLYTTNELEQLFEHMKFPDDPELGNEIEAVYETTIKATFLLYQDGDKEHGRGKRSFAVRFYHDDSNDPDPVFPSFDYAAEIRDVSNENSERELGFDEIAGLLQLDPDKPVWALETEPDEYEYE